MYELLISKGDVLNIQHTSHFTYQVDKKEENNDIKLSAILMQNISTDVRETCRFLCHFSMISFIMRPHAINDRLPPTLKMRVKWFMKIKRGDSDFC